MQQQASKNAAASQQTGSVSTLQGLENMVMTQSVGAPGPVMDYASSYRPSAQQIQQNAAINPLSPMTSIPLSWETSQLNHQQWQTMNQIAMKHLNHLPTAQMSMIPQQLDTSTTLDGKKP